MNMLHPFPYIQLRSSLQSLRHAYDILPDSSSIFQEGLYLSSPEFWQEFQRRDQLDEKAKNKLDISYAKYWLRSSARCTPYGTFAGSVMVSVTDEPSVMKLEQNSRHRRSLRLDMNYLTEIVHSLVHIPEITAQIKFFPNNSIYRTSEGYRYVEYSIADNTRHYHLTSFEKTPYIAALLASASQGATLEELSDILMDTEKVTREEAMGYLVDLWQSQLLVADAEPAVTGSEPLKRLITCLENMSTPSELLHKLKNIHNLLCHPEEGVGFYLQVEEKLRDLDLNINIPKNTLQADLFFAVKAAHISKDLVTAIVQQAGELGALSRQIKNAELREFKTKFYARYEDVEIPLSIALDTDLGIGYGGVWDESSGGGEFIDGLDVVGKELDIGPAFDYIQQFTLAKYNNWALNEKDAIEIQEEELKALKQSGESYPLPLSMHLMGSLLKQNGLLNAAHFNFDLAGFVGPSGANLLGRFTHGDDALCQFVKDILTAEEQAYPDCIYAEIAHLPQARTGNILLRPVLRKYEIPYVGLSGADKDHQIPVSDLFVSVRNGEVILRSKVHNKRIIPRLTTAHNFAAMSLPVYKFLCDLQGQGLSYPNVWDWGQLASLKYLPRVTYKNLIIHKALWKIAEEDLGHLPASGEEWPGYIATFRKRIWLPERVVYKEGDNELLIDFTHSKGVELFLHYLRRNKTIQLEEFLFTEENCVVSDIAGAPYTNELVIPVYQEVPVVNGRAGSPKPHKAKTSEKTVQRTFSPYSEWLYFKIYGGAKTLEHLLSDTLLQFVEDGIADGLFERFFFIRYRDDGGGHIRIRFFNTDKDRQLLVYKKLNQLLQPLVDNGTIHKVLLDTYKRELERYTPVLIDASETLFHNDSLAVLRFIQLLNGIDGERYRLLFAMRGIASLLADFGLSPGQKGDFLKERQAAFYKECGGQASLQKQLNERYRKNQRFITGHMDEKKDMENEIDDAATIFLIRSDMNGPIILNMLSEWREADRIAKLTELLASYIHMFVNRLFIAQQRKYELVVYHFLEKYYTSSMAIAKKEKSHAIPTL